MAVIPFNFKPDSTQQSTTTYTVPAGKYAYVTVTLNASISAGLGVTQSAESSYGNVSDSNSVVWAGWLDESQAITNNLVSTAPSGTLAANTSQTFTASAEMLIDATSVSKVTASVALRGSGTSSTIAGTAEANIGIHAAEYDF